MNRETMSKNTKVRTSITMSQDLLSAVDKLAGEYHSRSELIETVLRLYVAEMKHRRISERDIEIINRHAEKLNKEAMETLEYQVEL